MKKLICTSILAILIASVTTVMAKDYPKEYLGLPGDNLNLYAVMNLFQESETLEAFERSLNDENSRINNLDLNNDGYVDYVTVTDYANGEDHTIVLRSALDRNESQDVAVFTVEKLRNGEVRIQLIGDEALYGKNYIVEPIYAETPNPGYKGRTVYTDNVTVVTTTYYEVAAWPVIRFIYNPFYITWRSSWYWGYYPVYWNPWRPYYWHYYYGYHSCWYPHYYSHYRHWDYPRYSHYNDYYYRNVRAYSPNVSHRITEGHYKQTYSRPEARRDGEALYASTRGTRSSSDRQSASSGSKGRPAEASGSDRRSSTATGSSGRPAEASGSDNRTTTGDAAGQLRETVRRNTSDAVKSAPAANRGTSSTEASRPATTQRSQATQSSAQRSQSTAQRSQPSAQRSQSTAQKSEPWAEKAQSTVKRSEPTVQRSQSTAQRSQPSAQRSQSTAQRSQPSAQRSQSTAQRSEPSRQMTAQKSSPSASQRPSAPAAKAQTSSKSSSQGRSSSAPSQSRSSSSKSTSSKSSNGSDSDNRSSRR